jgi:pimeloyl-ACP methyl ester carboxylesterase
MAFARIIFLLIAGALAQLLNGQEAPLDLSLEVRITSSKDRTEQPAVYWAPPGASSSEKGPRIPLVVFLHSWSTDYKTAPPALEESRKRGWIFIGPNFRGPNDHPEACASDLAVQDILDSVNYALKRARVDRHRIYLVGSSGGGYMGLLMATKAPTLWAAVTTWVPITDLAEWYKYSKQVNSQYYKMMDQCFGGPADTPQRAAEYRRRSPLFELAKAKKLRIAIDSGLRDGHPGGAVPLSHTLLAFNALAKVNGHPEKMLSAEDIRIFTSDAKVPDHLINEKEEEAGRRQRVLFRRTAGPVRVTVFDGGHSVDYPTSFRWLDSLAPSK